MSQSIPSLPYSGGHGRAQMLVVNRTPFRVRLALFLMLLLIGYVAFCVVSLSPYAKQEFINTFLSPIFRLFGS
ncbi:hypothetical protein [Paracoccus sp. T5]|uniref:hypothetical protein n=1 Tax=Paracoccus sp. T5 TaxID=3402161 RepID=UPI003ADD2981